jgi:hypothetical protein
MTRQGACIIPDGLLVTVEGSGVDLDPRWRQAGGLEDWEVRYQHADMCTRFFSLLQDCMHGRDSHEAALSCACKCSGMACCQTVTSMSL